MKSPALRVLIAALCLLAMIGIGAAAYRSGKFDQRAADAAQSLTLQNEVSRLEADNSAMQVEEAGLRKKAEGNYYYKYDAERSRADELQAQVYDLQKTLHGYQFAGGVLSDAYNACRLQQAQIAEARQLQQTQGLEAAMKVLLLLLR